MYDKYLMTASFLFFPLWSSGQPPSETFTLVLLIFWYLASSPLLPFRCRCLSQTTPGWKRQHPVLLYFVPGVVTALQTGSVHQSVSGGASLQPGLGIQQPWLCPQAAGTALSAQLSRVSEVSKADAENP